MEFYCDLFDGNWCACSHCSQPEIKLSLQDAVDVFFQEEEIEYICETCGRTKAKLTHRFARLPRSVGLSRLVKTVKFILYE